MTLALLLLAGGFGLQLLGLLGGAAQGLDGIGHAAQLVAALDSLPIFKAGMLEILFLVPLAPYPGFGPAAV